MSLSLSLFQAEDFPKTAFPSQRGVVKLKLPAYTFWLLESFVLKGSVCSVLEFVIGQCRSSDLDWFCKYCASWQ